MSVRTFAVVAAAVLGLAACGNGDAPDEAATPTAITTDAATAAPEPTETEQAEPGEKDEAKTKTYKVKEGDSLSEIAVRFDTTVQELVRLNKIKDKHSIRAGQELKVPAGG